MHRTRIPILAVAASLALAACGSSGSSGNTSKGYGANAPTTAASAPDAAGAYGSSRSTTTASGASASPTSGSGEITVVHDATLGDVLATADGHTLYRFERDHGTTSACSGSCLDAWPPLVATSPHAGKGVTGSLTSVEGAARHQVAIDGHLLYEYSGDRAPGDTNGASIPDWYAVAPDGSTIEH